VPSIWLKRQCLKGYFHGKVKNNPLCIKIGRATPKRYYVEANQSGSYPERKHILHHKFSEMQKNKKHQLGKYTAHAHEIYPKMHYNRPISNYWVY
jgi:hypothetical protein